MRRWWWLALLAAACGRTRPVPVPPATGAAGLTVTLAWSLPADLDLYVTDPGLETVYYAMPRTRGGGVLEADVRCDGGGSAGGLERVHWTAPPPGRYRVGVDLPEVCRGRSQDVPYRLIFELGGRVQVLDGLARPGERNPAAGALTVPAERTP